MESKKVKILAIDDNPDNLVILRALILEMFPAFRVLTASDGIEGIALAHAEDPDVILLDILMPDMDGYEVCRKLKASAGLRDIPVVFVTALKYDRENRISALEAGADGFLAKPIDEAELAAQVKAMVKIKASHVRDRDYRDVLEQLVTERTKVLNLELAEKRKAEAELQESEERYRRITEGITDYVYSVYIESGQAVKTKHNPACEKVTGYTAEEFAADPFLWINMIPENERDVVTSRVEKVLQGKQVAPVEHHIRRKDGTLRWVSDTAILNRDEHGNLLAYEGVVRDITERKLLEETQSFLLQCGRPGSRENFFESLARYLSQTLEMEYVCIDRLEGDGLTAQTVAVYDSGVFIENSRYALKDTPCGQVVGRQICCYPDDVCRLFPDDAALLDLKAESYIGTTLWSFDGTPIGLIAVIGRHPLKAPGLAESLLKAVAVRAAGELERTRADEELRFRNSLLVAQQEVSIDGILVVDENGTILSFNKRFVEMWGIPSDIIESRSDDLALKAVIEKLADPVRFIDKVTYLYRHPDETSYDEIILKDGRVIDRHSVPVRGEDGRYYGRIWYFRDITERKKAELALRESAQRFRAIFESSPLGIALIDSHNGRIHEVNPRFARIAGRTLEQMAAIDWMSITHPDDLQEDIDNMALMNAGKIPGFSMQKRYIRSDGSHVWINMTIAPLPAEDNGGTCHLCMVEDITEKRAFEMRLRQSEKMEAIGQLAGGIAHDFNNVLGGIIGYTDMSLDLAERGSALDKNLRKVIMAADRAKKLVQQILTFSRQGNHRKSVTVLRPIIKEVMDLLRASIPSTVTFESEYQPDVKLVLADPTQIHEMLLNLATNAVHAMERKGVLMVRLFSTPLTCETEGRIGTMAPGEYAVIEIHDTGCGMDAQTLSKAFDPFYTTKPVGEGTGMGLSVVLGIIQSHGGDLQVESDVGKGTTFRIFLPVTKEKESDETKGEQPIACGGKEHILFVDDEMALVDVATEQFTNLGYTVTSMSNSLKALKYITKKSADIDVLITDQTMPGMTGSELAKEVLKIRYDMPIILCTGYSSEIDQEQAEKIGIRRLFKKPLRGCELAAAVREVIDNTNEEVVHDR